MKLWLRLSTGLAKTRTAIAERLQNLLPQGGRIGSRNMEELEKSYWLLMSEWQSQVDQAVKAGRVASWPISELLSAKLTDLQVEPGVDQLLPILPVILVVVNSVEQDHQLPNWLVDIVKRQRG